MPYQTLLFLKLVFMFIFYFNILQTLLFLNHLIIVLWDDKKNEQNEEPHWIQTIDCTQHFVNFDAIERFWRENHKSMLTLETLGSKWNGTMIVAWWQVSVMACVYVSSSASHSALCTNVELQFSRLLDAFHLKYISGMPTNANACDTNEPLHCTLKLHIIWTLYPCECNRQQNKKVKGVRITWICSVKD